jgi:hypothetical protein
MNPLKQRECGEMRRWWASQHDSGSAGDCARPSTIPDLVGRWANMTLFFSVSVYEQVKIHCSSSRT